MTDTSIKNLTAGTGFIDTDVVPYVDITADTTKKMPWSAFKSVLKTYFDTLYSTAVKATGAEVNTGTDDAKFMTPKAIADSSYTKSALPLAGGTMTGKVITAGKTEVAKAYNMSSGAQTATIDCSVNNIHEINGNNAGTALTLAISNATDSQPFIISITQGTPTVSTLTSGSWFSTIKWAGGTAPTLTATALKRDTFGFRRTGASTYDGFIIGQNC